MIYHPEALGGVPTPRFAEALQAEGVQCSLYGFGLTHRLKLFAEGCDVTGKGHGPLLDDYSGYPEGSLPITEDVHARIVAMPTYIEETPGYSEQVLEAIAKVAAHAAELG